MANEEAVFLVLDQIHEESEITELIHGGAKGADALAGKWADANGVRQVISKPDWGRYRRGAAVKNNQTMVDMGPDVVVAFPGGKGTADLVRRARKAGIRILMVPADSEAPNGQQ